MEYQVTDLHCRECAGDLEQRINSKQGGDYVQVDYENNQLFVSEKADIDKLEKILDFEKIIYSTGKQEATSDLSRQEKHSHDHSHSHSHAEMSEKNTRIVFFLNAVFAVLEFVFGNVFNSAALLADAVHDTGDALSIGLAWLFERLSLKEADEKYPFGYQRFSPLGAITTSIVLILGSIMMVINTIPQVFNPTPVNYQGLLWMSIIAIGVKLYAMHLMSKGSSQNEKLLNLHMLEDVFGWVAVLIVSIVLHFTNWYVLDPLLSIGIAIYILYEAVPMFLDTVRIFMETTPKDIDITELEKRLLAVEQIESISHLHVWTFDGEENIMIVTVSTQSNKVETHEQIKEEIREILFPFHITHTTIEVVVDESGILQDVRGNGKI